MAVIVWLWLGRRDPLLHLVPVALAFPPLMAYGGPALGWPGGWLSTRVALVACIALSLLFRVARRDFSYYSIPGMWFVAPYLLLVFASVLWGVLGPYNSEAGVIANELLSWVILVTLFLCIAGSAQGEGDLKRASQMLFGVGFGIAVYSGFQALALIGNTQLVPTPIANLTQYGRENLLFAPYRLYGTLPNVGPNFFGAFVLVPTILAFSRAYSERRLVRISWVLAGLVGVAMIVGTYSRGAMLGVVVALVMLPLWRRSLRGMASMVATLSVLAVGVAQTPVGRHVASLYAAGQFDVSGSARVYLWKAILKSSAEHPLGLGFDGWPRESRINLSVGLADIPTSIGTEHPAENQWMRELADRGIPGVLALALLLGGFARVTFVQADPRRSSGYSRDVLVATGAASVGWAVILLTGDHLTYDNVAGMFWYMMALSLAATRDNMQMVEPTHSSSTPGFSLATRHR